MTQKLATLSQLQEAQADITCNAKSVQNMISWLYTINTSITHCAQLFLIWYQLWVPRPTLIALAIIAYYKGVGSSRAHSNLFNRLFFNWFCSTHRVWRNWLTLSKPAQLTRLMELLAATFLHNKLSPAFCDAGCIWVVLVEPQRIRLLDCIQTVGLSSISVRRHLCYLNTSP